MSGLLIRELELRGLAERVLIVCTANLAFQWQRELIAKLAELGDEKVGRTNFYFATVKLNALGNQMREFAKFVVSKQFRRKRNQEIAHREQPEQWFEDRPIQIPYRTVVRGLAMAVRLMKAIDRVHLGPAAPYLWGEARRKRGQFLAPARAAYLLLHTSVSLPTSEFALSFRSRRKERPYGRR